MQLYILYISKMIKNDVGMGLIVLSLDTMSCLHTAISTSSLCLFWYSRPYIYIYIYIYIYVIYKSRSRGV